MKKVLLFAAIVSVVSLASCKKDSVCTGGSLDGSECTDCKGIFKTAFESSCTSSGGKVTKK